MKKLFFALLLAACVHLQGCKEIDRDLLTNRWEGRVVLLNKEPVDMDPTQVRLDIRNDGTYSYTDVMGNSQNGTFRTNKMGVLYLNPANGYENAWEVMKLTPDTLVLKVESVTKKYELILVAGEE